MIWSNFLPRRFAGNDTVIEPAPTSFPSRRERAETPVEKSVKPRANPANAMGALMNLVASQAGACQLSMVAPRQPASHEALGVGDSKNRWMAWVAAPYMPSAAALSAMGIDPASLLFIHARDEEHAIDVMEQALRSGTCAAVFAWLPKLSPEEQARLQRAAQEGNAWGTLFHETEQAVNENRKQGVGQKIVRSVANTASKAAVRVQQSTRAENYNLQLDF